MVEVVERSDATVSDVHSSAEQFGQFRKMLEPYKEVLDLWTSQYFGNKRAKEFLTLFGDDVLPVLRGENPGFNAVIGNPPYAEEKLDEFKFFFVNTFENYPSKIDLYPLFIQKGINLLASNGYFAQITTNTY